MLSNRTGCYTYLVKLPKFFNLDWFALEKMLTKKARKAGLPPGTLIPLEEKRPEKVKVTVIDYDEEHFQEREIASVEECFPFRDTATTTWINVDGLYQLDIIEKLGACFDIHPLILEDILTTGQRPKAEDLGNYIFIVVKMFSLDEMGNMQDEQVSLVVGSNFVISFQEKMGGDVFGLIRERLRTNKGRSRKMGADYLAYSLLDAIVDNCFVILDRLGDKIDLLEDEIMGNSAPDTLPKIHQTKRELIYLRKSIWPLREIIGTLERSESPLIKPATLIYLRDVYDHTIQIIDTVETFRDIIAELINVYLSNISNTLNKIMKVLTVIATIFMPLTFIAGVYGMNFKYMPELNKAWGYPFALGLMLASTLAMLAYFRKQKWL